MINLKEIIRQIALIKITQAESLITGSNQGTDKLEYVVNLVIDELKKFPLPIYIKIPLVLCQFVFKPEIRKEVQSVFDQAKTFMASPAAITNA